MEKHTPAIKQPNQLLQIVDAPMEGYVPRAKLDEALDSLFQVLLRTVDLPHPEGIICRVLDRHQKATKQDQSRVEC